MSFYPEAVASGYDFQHQGKTYHVGLITQEIKAKFERAVWQKEKAKLQEVRDLLSQETYREKAEALAERYLKGEFSIVQEDMTKSPMSNPENTLTMMSLMCGIDELEMMKIAASNSELPDLMKLAMRDSFPGVKVGDEKK